MPMINGIRLPYGNESMLGQNYGLLGEMRANSPTGGRLGAIPSGINPAAAGNPLGDAVAALRAKSFAATPPAAAVGPGRMPQPMPIPPMISLDGGQPAASPMGVGMGFKPSPPLFFGENATFPETGANISNAWKNLFSNIGGFFGGGGSQFPNWTGGGTAPLNQVPYTGFTLPKF